MYLAPAGRGKETRKKMARSQGSSSADENERCEKTADGEEDNTCCRRLVGELCTSRLEARVARCRHHGRNLVFVSLCDGGGLVRQVVFNSQHFGSCTCRSPRFEKFPSNKASIRVGDELALLVREVDGRQVVRAWQRLSCQRGEGAARTAVAPSGRRSGVAAESGWVGCPLCPPSSPKRYNRRGGLKTHLEAIHTGGVEVLGKDGLEAGARVRNDWSAVLDEADRNGVFMSRVAVGTRRNNALPSGNGPPSSSHTARELPHPGLTAARDGDVETLKALILQGWDPLSAWSLDRHGASALDWAAGNGHLHCLIELLPLVGRRQVCRRDGRGPAHWAARCGHANVLTYLLEQRATGAEHADVPTGDGSTMLMLAAFGGHLDVADVLVNRFGAQIAKVNAWGCDAAHFAAMGGNVEVCKWLHGLGLIFSRPQSKGHTALHKAADRGSAAVLRWLLTGGGLAASELEYLRAEGYDVSNEHSSPDVRKSRRRHRSPAQLAIAASHDECAELLRANGF